MRLTYLRVITAGAALLFIAGLGFVTRGSIGHEASLATGQGGSHVLTAPSQPAAAATVSNSSSTRLQRPLRVGQLKTVNIGLSARGSDDGFERSQDDQHSEGGDDGG